MIKSFIKYITLYFSIIFLITCSPEDILENFIGEEFLWLCPDNNTAYDDVDDCNSLCSGICISYTEDEIVSWTFFCEELDEYYDTMPLCQEACPNSCIVETDS
tara:strand:- start:476 stop:784 length:309 start_codon:yes stop_codon:yes gene_type:complete